MDSSFLRPIKYSEHKTVTKKPTKTKRPVEGRNEPNETRIVRISVTDTDATDSSSDNEEVCQMFVARKRVKRFVHEINIEPAGCRAMTAHGLLNGGKKRGLCDPEVPEKRALMVSCPAGGSGRKFRGVRQRPWGKWAAEIRDPVRRVRLWLGTYNTVEEALMVYDNAVMKLRGPDALTNFKTPTPSKEKPATTEVYTTASSRCGGGGYDTAQESRVISSPTSVLLFRNSQCQSTEDPGPMKPKPVKECQDESSSVSFDSTQLLHQLDDIPYLDEFFNFEAPEINALFGEPLPESISVDDFMRDAFVNTCEEMGTTLLNVDDYFEDIGNLFASDPFMAL